MVHKASLKGMKGISEGNVQVGKKALDNVGDLQMDRRGKTFGSEDGNGLSYVLENLGR